MSDDRCKVGQLPDVTCIMYVRRRAPLVEAEEHVSRVGSDYVYQACLLLSAGEWCRWTFLFVRSR